MHGEHTPQCIASMLIVLGMVLILVRLYTTWDMWVVVGAILIVKGAIHVIMPKCCCQTKVPKKKK